MSEYKRFDKTRTREAVAKTRGMRRARLLKKWSQEVGK